jgi:undecaprenyl-diphosphatase
MVALGVAVFAVSAALATNGLGVAEWRVFETFNDVPVPLAWALLAAMPLGSGEAAMIVPAVFLVLRRWELAMATGLAGPVAWLLAQLGKAAGLRGRPVDVLDAFAPTGEATGSGFPSGHTAVAVAFAVALWPYLPRPVRPVLVLAAVAVAVARMHVGVHLPLDLVGGAGIGLGVGAVAVLLVTTRR